MSTRKSSLFYGVLIGLASLVVGMVIASRLDLTPASSAGFVDAPAVNSSPLSGPLDAGTFRTIAQDAGPAVVSIRTTSTTEARGIQDLFGFQNPFGGRRGTPQPVQGAGSGFVIDKTNGYILTNNHVVDGADRIEVHLASQDDRAPWLEARLVGRDQLTDSALIQLAAVPKAGIGEAKFGDSGILAPGDWVMAIGNPFGLSNTVTVGVVSAVGRLQSVGGVRQRFEEMIQTDAAINRGNSGGPLFNIRGEVVGINTMIVSDDGGGNLGIGFSVPINTVRDILPGLRAGKVVRGRIGVSVDNRPFTPEDIEDLGLPASGGALISVVGDGPAKDAGIRIADVIVEFNGRTVRNSHELVGMVTRTAPGTTVPVKLIRNGKPLTLSVKIAELDIEAEQGQVAERDAARPGRPETQRTAFGMEVSAITPAITRQLRVPAGQGGAVITSVDPASAAAEAGAASGDVILSVNGQPVQSVTEVTSALDRVPAGRNARLVVWRDGEQQLVVMRKR
jgi:serine protease Do